MANLIAITASASSLDSGDRLGKNGRFRVRYATLSDSGAAILVYVEGDDQPWRYGRNEVITKWVEK